MTETVRYTYRLRPGAQAERALMEEWGRCRWLWNEAVHQQRSGRRPTFTKLCKLLTEARAAFPWLRAGAREAQAQMLRTYAQALQHSFTVKGRGRPAVKTRRRARPSLNYVAPKFRLRDGRLVLSKGTTIPVVWSRELPSAPTSVRVHRDSLGHWYASFVVRRETVPPPPGSGGVGIDWGVTTTATASDPMFDLPYGGHRKRCAAELARAQRKMARRHRGRGVAPSTGYQRARRQTARLHKKAQRQTIHDAQVWAKRAVDAHQLVAVEDFHPQFLARSTMARKAADAAIGATKRELIDRATRAGRRVVIVSPAYTTMTCAHCFARAKQRLTLDERTFRCWNCGYVDSRDRNAARVILAVAERGHTSVDDVRRDTVLPSGTPGRRAI